MAKATTPRPRPRPQPSRPRPTFCGLRPRPQPQGQGHNSQGQGQGHNPQGQGHNPQSQGQGRHFVASGQGQGLTSLQSSVPTTLERNTENSCTYCFNTSRLVSFIGREKCLHAVLRDVESHPQHLELVSQLTGLLIQRLLLTLQLSQQTLSDYH